MTGLHSVTFKKPRFFFILFPALAAAGLWAAIFVFNRPVEVAYVQPRKGTAIDAVYATAVVEPVNWAAVAPTQTGRIVSIAVHEGQAVKAGDILAEQESGDLHARQSEVQAQQRLAAKELERVKALLKSGYATVQQKDRAQSALDQANAALRQVGETIGKSALRAPVDGVVLWRDIEPGEVATATQTLFWIGQPSPVWAVAEVDEEDIPRVRIGQEVMLTADAFRGKAFAGTVAQITPKGDPLNKSYRVRVSLSEDTPLMIGMTAETNIIINKIENTLLIPADAITSGSKVFVVDGNRAALREVKTGIYGNKSMQVLEGLTENDKVLLNPPPELGNGDRVHAVATKTETP